MARLRGDSVEFLDAWLDIIRQTNTVSTYKMAWAKAITHIACDMDDQSLNDTERTVSIPLEAIAEKFLGYYWDQDVFFRLLQNSNPHKLAEIVTLVRKTEETFYAIQGDPKPEKFHMAAAILKGKMPEFYTTCIDKTTRILKQDVSYRFLSPGQFPDYQWVYGYTQGDDQLLIKARYLSDMKQNLSLILDVINLRWVMILEQYNHSPRIARKVRHMDIQKADRASLKKYHEHILLENPGMKCFDCGRPITAEELAVDHVIPWSYLFSDDIWNLVFVHRSCNSRKSNTIPSEAQVEALKQRNRRLCEALKSTHINKNKMIFELEDAIENDLVRKFWIQCQG